MVISFPAPALKNHQGILEQCGEKIQEFPAQRMTQELGAGKKGMSASFMLLVSMDWFKGKFTGNHGFYH